MSSQKLFFNLTLLPSFLQLTCTHTHIHKTHIKVSMRVYWRSGIDTRTCQQMSLKEEAKERERNSSKRTRYEEERELIEKTCDIHTKRHTHYTQTTYTRKRRLIYLWLDADESIAFVCSLCASLIHSSHFIFFFFHLSLSLLSISCLLSLSSLSTLSLFDAFKQHFSTSCLRNKLYLCTVILCAMCTNCMLRKPEK